MAGHLNRPPENPHAVSIHLIELVAPLCGATHPVAFSATSASTDYPGFFTPHRRAV